MAQVRGIRKPGLKHDFFRGAIVRFGPKIDRKYGAIPEKYFMNPRPCHAKYEKYSTAKEYPAMMWTGVCFTDHGERGHIYVDYGKWEENRAHCGWVPATQVREYGVGVPRKKRTKFIYNPCNDEEENSMSGEGNDFSIIKEDGNYRRNVPKTQQVMYYTFLTVKEEVVAEKVAGEVEVEWRKKMEEERRKKEALMDVEGEDQVREVREDVEEERLREEERGLNILQTFRGHFVEGGEASPRDVTFECQGGIVVAEDNPRDIEDLMIHGDRMWQLYYVLKYKLMRQLGFSIVKTKPKKSPRAPIMELSLTYDIIRGNVRGSLGERADGALSICHQGSAPYISAICHTVGMQNAKARSLELESKWQNRPKYICQVPGCIVLVHLKFAKEGFCYRHGPKEKKERCKKCHDNIQVRRGGLCRKCFKESEVNEGSEATLCSSCFVRYPRRGGGKCAHCLGIKVH
jgi:hypothetical protein